MKLYKAIRYTGCNRLTSYINDSYTYDASIYDLVKCALGHVKKANQYKEEVNKDYWLSATYDYNKAKEYLEKYNESVEHSKYMYNGIAVIDLPSIMKTGYIYDDTLRNFGYIEKEMINNTLQCRWKTEQGVVWIIDLSSEYTLNYLSSICWLKNNEKLFRNFRIVKTSMKDKEVLILCDNVEFEFISYEQAMIKNEVPVYELPDYYKGLYDVFIKRAPDNERTRKIYNDISKTYYSEENRYRELYNEEAGWIQRNVLNSEEFSDDTSLYIDEKELRSRFNEASIVEKDKEVLPFYKNVSFCFNREKAKKRFLEYSKLRYEDKECIDFDEYDAVSEGKPIGYEVALTAYIYSGYNMINACVGKMEYIKTLIWMYGENSNINDDWKFASARSCDHVFEKLYYLGYNCDEN